MHHAVVAETRPGDVVPNTPDRDQQAFGPSEIDGPDDVFRAGAADDHCRPPVDHRIVYFTCFVIVWLAGKDQLSAQRALKLLQSGLSEHAYLPVCWIAGRVVQRHASSLAFLPVYRRCGHETMMMLQSRQHSACRGTY